MVKDEIDIEIDLLLEAIYSKYGYDFREYSRAHIKRRILNRLKHSRLKNISEMQNKLLHNKEFAVLLLQDLSITVTEMFRNPDFYKEIRNIIVPVLRTYPFIKVWHAGCSTGEEVYSFAILLEEENLLKRSTIYATDFNPRALSIAKEGIYPKKLISEFEYNYTKSGGKEEFSNYFTEDSKFVKMKSYLSKNVVWANHNLVTDSVFSTVNIILCRNVLIYFNKNLQDKVQELFYNSLVEGGFLCLGSKESIRFTSVENKYTEINKAQKLFKKKY
jgi:chemotaxis protein methyltransferase CheR